MIKQRRKHLLIAALLLACSMFLAACDGGSDKRPAESPEAVAAGVVTAFKTGDKEAILTYTGQDVLLYLDKVLPLNLAGDDQMSQQLFSQLGYHIIDSQILDDTAIVTIDITNVNYGIVMGKVMGEVSKDFIKHGRLDAETLNARFLAGMETGSQEMVTTRVEMKMVAKKGHWVLSDNEEFMDALTGGMISGMKDASSGLVDGVLSEIGRFLG